MNVICGCNKIRKKKEKKNEGKKKKPSKDSLGESLASTWIEMDRKDKLTCPHCSKRFTSKVWLAKYKQSIVMAQKESRLIAILLVEFFINWRTL